LSAAVTFHIHGTSKTPYRSLGPSTIGQIGTVSVDAGAGIGGSIINLDQGSAGQRALIYPARGGNVSTVNKMSVLCRAALGDTGSARVFFSITGPALIGRVALRYTGTQLRVDVADEVTGATINFGTVNWSPVAGTYYDLCLVLDCSTTTSGLSINLYVDGTSVLAPNNATGTWSNPTNPDVKNIMIGTDDATTLITTRMKLDEFAVWNDKVDPTGTGLNLNGATRSSYVTSTAFNGDSYTDPGVAAVKTGTSYTYAGTAQSGTYDGSDRWTDPGIANVRSGTAYKANSISNNRTGTAAIPTAANVRSGTAVDATTGSLAVPAAADVRSGTAVDAGTGTLDLPSIANVKTGVTFDGASKTGTYDGSDRWTDPGVANVRSGTAYKANSTSNNRTGTAVVSAAATTKHGVTADDGTGTYRGADLWTAVVADDVLEGAGYLADGVSLSGLYRDVTADRVKAGTQYGWDGFGLRTGTYDGSDLWSSPAADELKHGVQLKSNSTTDNLTGTYRGADLWSSPGADELKHGVALKSDSLTDNLVGTYRGADLWTAFLPAQVAAGEQALQDGNAVVGTFVGAQVPSTAREVANAILKFLGAPSLTDDEWTSMSIDESSTPQALYEALDAVLASRGALSSIRDRLKFYFAAKGVGVFPVAEDQDEPHLDIYMGSDLSEAPDTPPTGESNLFLGGEL
jgi:hypothetical protein